MPNIGIEYFVSIFNAEYYTDVNLNNQWDDAEEFEDELNGVWDEGEEFIDLKNN